MVDPFVATAQQAEPTRGTFVGGSQLVSKGLVKTSTTWTQQEQGSWWLSSLNRGKDRFGSHHHAGASAKGGIIDGAMNIRCVLAQIVVAQIKQA
jgi:hypothetical protein